VRIRMALVVTLALLAAVPAEAARDIVVRDSPRAAVATCLRATATPGLVGLLGPLERRMSPYDLVRVSPDGVTLAATARLGILDECPAVAADPSGHAVVAGAVRARKFRGIIRAALAEPGGGFGAPIDIARTRGSMTPVAAAVSPRGDAVVAWTVTRQGAGRGFPDGRTRVIAALRQAGGTFGPRRFLTPWRGAGFAETATVSVGMEASGRATVAWAQPNPSRPNTSRLSNVAVATAAPGEAFAPVQVLTRRVYDAGLVALSVAPDGRAVLAHDGQGTVQVFERAAGGSEFASAVRLQRRRGFSEWQDPDVALAPDGSALVAWRGGDETGLEDVFVASRRGTGPWTAPVAVQRGRDDGSLAVSYGVLLATRGKPSPPLDEDNTRVRAAVGPDGRYLVTWSAERPLPLGDRRLAPRLAQGQAGGRPSDPETAGCACRSINGVVALTLPGGETALAYTDNVTTTFAFGVEFARRAGRLHVAGSGPPGLSPPAPRLRVRPPRAMTLGYGNRLRVRVGCDRPCDLRAYVVGGRDRARGLAVGTLREAGSTRLAIKPAFEEHLAPPARGRARVVVHGYAPNGRRFTSQSVPVDLRRKPLRPLPRVLNVRAVRRGGAVVVTWQTATPARRVSFRVKGRLSRRDRFPIVEDSTPGRGGRTFRLRLSLREVRELGEVTVIAVSVVRDRPPHDRRTVVVPVNRSRGLAPPDPR
jgi:hypothetical protein